MLKGGRKRRNVMTDATFLITGDISHVHTALVNFEFTINAYPTATAPAQTQYITIPKRKLSESDADSHRIRIVRWLTAE